MTVLNIRSACIGILATMTMDVLSGTALKLGLIASLPPRLTGRWFALVARGQFLHNNLAQVPPINRELAIALPVHYTIGITLALVYLLVSSALGAEPAEPDRSAWLWSEYKCSPVAAYVSFHGIRLVRRSQPRRNAIVPQ